jgi:hypothetical protein
MTKNWRFREPANPRIRERDSMKWASMESGRTSFRIRVEMVPQETRLPEGEIVCLRT